MRCTVNGMAKPLTKSPPIHFRIDIGLWPTLVTRAELAGLSVGDYVRDRVERSLRTTTQAAPVSNTTPAKVTNARPLAAVKAAPIPDVIPTPDHKPRCDHNWQINKYLAYDTCIHCEDKKWHTK